MASSKPDLHVEIKQVKESTRSHCETVHFIDIVLVMFLCSAACDSVLVCTITQCLLV